MLMMTFLIRFAKSQESSYSVVLMRLVDPI
jgi:hypothetical protein